MSRKIRAVIGEYLHDSSDAAVVSTKESITDEDILALLDEVYLLTKEQLQKRNHRYVLPTLLWFHDFDLWYRRIIYSQLSPGLDFDEDLLLPEETLQYIVMQQSFINSFRINILSDTTTFITNEFNLILEMVKYDFQQSVIKFRFTNNLVKFYMSNFDHWYRIQQLKDDHLEKLYQESIMSFHELRTSANIHLRKLIGEQLKNMGHY